jgi:CBS domain-containing protein
MDFLEEMPMRVQDVMTSPAHSCAPDASLAAAALAMRDYDCGAMPVLDAGGRPVGILTDRDVCMAVAQKNRFPAAIRVSEVMTLEPFTCSPGTGLGDVLVLMAACQIRRLPVVDGDGRLVGIVSLSDIVSAVEDRAAPDASLRRQLAAAFRRICEPRDVSNDVILTQS